MNVFLLEVNAFAMEIENFHDYTSNKLEILISVNLICVIHLENLNDRD